MYRAQRAILVSYSDHVWLYVIENAELSAVRIMVLFWQMIWHVICHKENGGIVVFAKRSAYQSLRRIRKKQNASH
jgi:hypothetical protein